MKNIMRRSLCFGLYPCVFMTWVAPLLRHNDPSSIKRHLPHFKTIDSGAQSYPQRRDCLIIGAESFCESPEGGLKVFFMLIWVLKPLVWSIKLLPICTIYMEQKCICNKQAFHYYLTLYMF